MTQQVLKRHKSLSILTHFSSLISRGTISMAGSSKKKAKDGRTSPTKETAKARKSPEKEAGKSLTSPAKKTTQTNDEEAPPRNFEEYCVKHGKAVLAREEIHP